MILPKSVQISDCWIIARIGIPAPQMDAPPETAQTNFLDTLQAELQAQLEEKAGLGPLKDVLVRKPADFKLLKTNEFKHLREKLTLTPFLPKPPALAEFAFLLQKKGGPLLKEQFENHWQAASLNYAAAAQVFGVLVGLTNEGKIAHEEALTYAADNLLTASNVLAKALATYKAIAVRQANKSGQQTGEREKILSTEDAKAIQSTLDTANKLQKATKPKQIPFNHRFRGRRRAKYPWWRRGRGRGNYRGKGRAHQYNTESKE